jgi:hypothetical protein
MHKHSATPLQFAVRVYPVCDEHFNKRKFSKKGKKEKRWRRPDAMFVFDTETRTDPTQSLMFGSYRFIQQGQCVQEAIFYADDILPTEYALLEKYVSDHNRNSSTPIMPNLELIKRAEFVERLFQAVYKGRSLLVGF